MGAEVQAITITQIHEVASLARDKLSAAAEAADHDLRLLVGHANFLDGNTARRNRE